jgi:hypothetical protein
MSAGTTNKATRDFIPLKNAASMFIPNNVMEQIRFLHSQVGHFEWSGFLLMDLKGTLTDIPNLEARVEGIFPCDIGTAGFTTYDPAEHMEACWDQFPEHDFLGGGPRWNGEACQDGKKMGQIHTHHSLSGGAYFSGVDDGELDENAGVHGLYISLIVAMDGRFVAKGAFVSEVEEVVTMQAKDFDGTALTYTSTTEKLVTFPFDIEYETEDWFQDRFFQLAAEAQARKAAEAEGKKEQEVLTKIGNWTKHRQDKTQFVLSDYHIKALIGGEFDWYMVDGYGYVYISPSGVYYGLDAIELTEEEVTQVTPFIDALIEQFEEEAAALAHGQPMHH